MKRAGETVYLTVSRKKEGGGIKRWEFLRRKIRRKNYEKEKTDTSFRYRRKRERATKRGSRKHWYLCYSRWRRPENKNMTWRKLVFSYRRKRRIK